MELIVFLNEEVVCNCNASSITTKTDNGNLEILDKHQNLIAQVKEFLQYRDEAGNTHNISFDNGFLYTDGSQTRVVLKYCNN